jgi:Ca2+-binding EF-hand superfamily protein
MPKLVNSRRNFVYSYSNLIAVIRGDTSFGTTKENKMKIFDELDTHGGIIVPAEFGALMNKGGYAVTAADVNDFFRHIYADNSNELDYDEFLAHVWESKNPKKPHSLEPQQPQPQAVRNQVATAVQQRKPSRQTALQSMPTPPRQSQSSKSANTWGARKLRPLDVSPQPSETDEQVQHNQLSPLKQAQVTDSIERRVLRDQLESDLRKRMGGNNWQNLLEILRKADTNKSGNLDQKEFRNVLREFGMQVCASRI